MSHHSVSVSADNFTHDNPLQGGDPTWGQLINVVSQAQLSVAVVAPAVHVAVLQGNLKGNSPITTSNFQGMFYDWKFAFLIRMYFI